MGSEQTRFIYSANNRLFLSQARTANNVFYSFSSSIKLLLITLATTFKDYFTFYYNISIAMLFLWGILFFSRQFLLWEWYFLMYCFTFLTMFWFLFYFQRIYPCVSYEPRKLLKYFTFTRQKLFLFHFCCNMLIKIHILLQHRDFHAILMEIFLVFSQILLWEIDFSHVFVLRFW